MEAPGNIIEGSEPPQDLPLEIITEILLGLPVKPLLKFKCVCKTWCSLISSSQFTKAHLKISKNSKNYANHRVMLLSPEQPYSTCTCSLSSILDSNVPVDLITWPVIPSENTWIYGSCNGLLCVQCYHQPVVLYNPTTRKSKTLPDSGTNPGLDWLCRYYESYISYGIFYHELDDDYRLVEVRDFRGPNYDRVAVVKFYSLRSNSWRKINDDLHYSVSSFYTNFGSDPGILVDGVFYWSINGDKLRRTQIFAVNTITHTHQILAGPKYDNRLRRGNKVSVIIDFGGILGVCHIYHGTRVDIMVMKESWTKVVSVFSSQHPWKYITPLVGFKDGEILMKNESGYMVYNSREKTFVKQDMSIEDLCVRGVASPVYIESLVAPNYDGE